MDLDEIDWFNNESSYDELWDTLKGSTTYVSEDGDTWEEYDRALRDLNILKESGQLEEISAKNPESYGLSTLHEAKVAYSLNGETEEVYFKALE